MRLVQFSSVIILAFLAACSGGSGILAPPAAGLQALDLSPAPLELTNDEPAVAFTVTSIGRLVPQAPSRRIRKGNQRCTA